MTERVKSLTATSYQKGVLAALFCLSYPTAVAAAPDSAKPAPPAKAAAKKEVAAAPAVKPSVGAVSRSGAGVPPLPAGQGVIFANPPSALVPLRDQNGKIRCQLADGQVVKVLESHSGIGEGDSNAEIEGCGGIKGTIPNARVLTAERVQRAKDGSMAVFSAIYSCGDACHSELWLFLPGGKRLLVSDDAGLDVKATFSPRELRLTMTYSTETDDGPHEGKIVYKLQPAALLELKTPGPIEEAADGSLIVKDSGQKDPDGAPRRVGSRS